MTNIDELNPSLQTVAETMADNLTAKGVPSTASEGLTTLADKILDINANIVINDSSYFDTNMKQYGAYMGSKSNDNNNIRLNSPILLPSKWEISWTMINTRASSAWCFVNIEDNQSTRINIGKITRALAGAYLPNETVSESDSISSNVEYPMSVRYDGINYYLIFNNHNMSIINPLQSPLYFVGFGLAAYSGNGARIKDVIVKEL